MDESKNDQHHHHLQGLAFWPPPISRLGELIHPSHQWLTLNSSSFRVIIKYFLRIRYVGIKQSIWTVKITHRYIMSNCKFLKLCPVLYRQCNRNAYRILEDNIYHSRDKEIEGQTILMLMLWNTLGTDCTVLRCCLWGKSSKLLLDYEQSVPAVSQFLETAFGSAGQH
jgi:hypothetical protein